jgi:hypothetical protein
VAAVAGVLAAAHGTLAVAVLLHHNRHVLVVLVLLLLPLLLLLLLPLLLTLPLLLLLSPLFAAPVLATPDATTAAFRVSSSRDATCTGAHPVAALPKPFRCRTLSLLSLFLAFVRSLRPLATLLCRSSPLVSALCGWAFSPTLLPLCLSLTLLLLPHQAAMVCKPASDSAAI